MNESFSWCRLAAAAATAAAAALLEATPFAAALLVSEPFDEVDEADDEEEPFGVVLLVCDELLLAEWLVGLALDVVFGVVLVVLLIEDDEDGDGILLFSWLG